MKKYLLDTHILIWYFDGNEKLPQRARKIITGSNEIYYSPISIFEIDIKHLKHPENMPLTGEKIFELCRRANFISLPLKNSHVLAVKNLTRRENTLPHDDRIAEYDSPNIYKV